MDSLTASIEITVPSKQAFDCFIRELTLWWPKAYSWSKEKLVELSIEPILNGLCSEIGPNGFRCDWGTVIDVDPGKSLSMRWQITPARNPEPDPEQASTVHFRFEAISPNATRIVVMHEHFQHHGEQYQDYRDAMASEHGWPFILSSFAKYMDNRGRG